eukprot:CAMPEP_0116878596 /NCGR_PEP_ID=MMETSP0463-20121206/10339_1 /TAXON_ID=181622 /ORGANISM="Strombidinopsis sp, Strain SopsisLIS2011" /LENGTH=120 /DNA_ID=CAMNT_0004526961 /DNA_START=774 /DNA_END=1136 /DNA_ORIENTATION=-
MRSKIAVLDWDTRKDPEAGYVFATRFAKPNGNAIFCGSAGKNEMKIFDNNGDNFRVLGSMHDFGASVLTMDTAKNGKQFCFGTSDGRVVSGFYEIDNDNMVTMDQLYANLGVSGEERKEQ